MNDKFVLVCVVRGKNLLSFLRETPCSLRAMRPKAFLNMKLFLGLRRVTSHIYTATLCVYLACGKFFFPHPKKIISLCQYMT